MRVDREEKVLGAEPWFTLALRGCRDNEEPAEKPEKK